MFKFFVILFVSWSCLFCCSNDKRPAKQNNSSIDDIIERAQLYKNLIVEFQDEHGFIYSDECDSLLFSGLISASGVSVDIDQAGDGSGKYYRTPYRDCFRHSREDAVHSRRSSSEISRDMFAGLFWSTRNYSDVARAKRIIDYGKKHNWVMGRGSLDRVYLTSNFVETLYKLADKTYKGPSSLWVDPIKDHQRHVVALNIALRGDIDSEISDRMYNLIKKFHKSSPNNKLFSFIRNLYSDGDQSDVIEFLRSEKYFPKDRLPSSREYCGGWLWERHESKDSWLPCDENKIHSGGDYIFLVYLLRRNSTK